MGFDAPAWWLLVPIFIVYLVWLSRRSYAQLARASKWSALALRIVILCLLIAAVTQPVWLVRSNRNHLVFMLDVSKSISSDNLQAALDDVDKLAKSAGEQSRRSRFSLIAFGASPRLLVSSASQWSDSRGPLPEQLLYQQSLPSLYAKRTRLISAGTEAGSEKLAEISERIKAAETFRDEVAGDQTNLEAAVRLALNCGSTNDRRTIYLFTDGNFTRGRWQQALRAVSARSAALHVVRLDKQAPPEVAAIDLSLPARVRINQGFTAKVRFESSIETEAVLSIFKDGFLAERREVQLNPGENVFSLGGLFFREKGFHNVEAIIRPDTDTKLENNRIRSLIVVPGKARVLYVDRDEDQILHLKSALELEGMQVEARPASGVPQELSELLSFDAFILSNVPADRLSLRQMQMIRTYVEGFGGGFIMLGGDESFGLGGYFNTPIEEILPVKMPIQKDLIRPSLALMLVIDKSGSMDGVKIQLAKRAAVATAEVINPRDQIGVIGFDGASRLVLELTPAADRATVTSRIASLSAGGGTFLYPALEDAHQRLQETNARRKHVIVLSDGQTQGYGYEDLVQGMAADGITVSTVGIGDGADMNLLESIALAGGGRSYFTNDFYSIPQIFTREALRASKSMLVEGLFQPVPVADDVCLSEIDADELPLLMGYVATSPRDAAQTILVSESGDPLLAKWRYGLGHTVAFTSETKPRWAEDWLAWPDFAKFWSQLVRSVTGEELANQFVIECSHRLEADGVTITADVRDSSGDFPDKITMEATTIDPAGNSRSLTVQQRGPGLYEARIPEVVYGRPQQTLWTLKRGVAVERTSPYGFVYSFSPEFRSMGVATDTLRQIAARGLGDSMSVGNSKLHLGGVAKPERHHVWQYLLVAALLLIPFDILSRRLG